MLKNALYNIGEQQFWKLWHRAYKKNLKNAERKNVIVEQYLGSFVQEMKKSEFIFDEDPEIEIVSKSESAAVNDVARANLVPQLMAILQDPTTLPFTRTIIQRKILEINGVEHDEAMLLTGTSASELDALSKRVLLDHDNML
jgi:hypothetical protein